CHREALNLTEQENSSSSINVMASPPEGDTCQGTEQGFSDFISRALALLLLSPIDFFVKVWAFFSR
ncbi:MAG: hypothetical protein Q8S09_17230, partial [Hyphomonas sp.]|nr:hypothetical protein [Hyphomonas sp.]